VSQAARKYREEKVLEYQVLKDYQLVQENHPQDIQDAINRRHVDDGWCLVSVSNDSYFFQRIIPDNRLQIHYIRDKMPVCGALSFTSNTLHQKNTTCKDCLFELGQD
jgi:hypothetical protein